MFVLECLHIMSCGSAFPNTRADLQRDEKCSLCITNDIPGEKSKK